jgi:hypothetical protein
MATALKMDQADYLGMMEGYAFHGLKGKLHFPMSRSLSQIVLGTAKNHQARQTELRAQVRHEINKKLCKRYSSLYCYK